MRSMISGEERLPNHPLLIGSVAHLTLNHSPISLPQREQGEILHSRDHSEHLGKVAGGPSSACMLRAWKAYQIPIAEHVGPTRRAASKLRLGCPERWAAYITERALVLPPSRCEIPTSTKRLSAGPKVHCTAASLSTNTGCHCCIPDQPHQGQRSFGVAATRHLAISPSLAMDSRMVP